MKGAFNAVAPEHKTNDDFTKSVAKVLNKPLFMPKVPSSFLRLLFGEMSVIILNGSRVSSEKICSKGFEFKFLELEDALRDLIMPAIK
jgi:NAD dependent epimerase/dehydratase family enzyme